jgi:uncharacterized membrane protein YkgB
VLLALVIVAVLLLAYGLWARNAWIAGAGAVTLLVLLILSLLGAFPPAYRY